LKKEEHIEETERKEISRQKASPPTLEISNHPFLSTFSGKLNPKNATTTKVSDTAMLMIK